MMHNNMYYPQPNGGNQQSCYDYDYYYAADPYSHNAFNSSASSTSSYVDCTLSLGTPATRSEIESSHTKKQSGGSRRIGSRVSNFCWDLLQQTTSSSSKHSSGNPTTCSKSTRGGGAGGGDPLVARRCASCDTTSTPLWRNGPKGPKSLCNACGIRYKKEERRASAPASATSNSGASAMESSHYTTNEHYYNQYQTQKMNCLFPTATDDQYRSFMDTDESSHSHHYEHVGNGGGVSFLPWMMNVADRTSLVHDY